MNALRNRVQLIGNLGNDPELVTFDNGTKMTRFSVATNESYKNADGDRVEDTQWHTVVAWGKTAEIVEKYVKKGQEIALEGKLMHRSYEDESGEKKYVTEVKCIEVLLLQGNK